MSNTLFINVVKLETLGTDDVEYGFTASDTYARDYDFGYKSLADFHAAFPNADALKAHVLGLEAFWDFREGETGYVFITFPENTDTATMTDDQMRALCEANGVRVVEATEDEVRGMWDWLDEAGNACDQSFATEREAMQDAILQLDLE